MLVATAILATRIFWAFKHGIKELLWNQLFLHLLNQVICLVLTQEHLSHSDSLTNLCGSQSSQLTKIDVIAILFFHYFIQFVDHSSQFLSLLAS